jgi:hypothetical protein
MHVRRVDLAGREPHSKLPPAVLVPGTTPSQKEKEGRPYQWGSRANPAQKTTSFPPLPSLAANPSSQDPQIPSPVQPHCGGESAVPPRPVRAEEVSRVQASRIAGSVLYRRPFLLVGFSSFCCCCCEVLPLFLRRRLHGEWQPLY